MLSAPPFRQNKGPIRMPDEMLDHALKYAGLGWPVFALQPKDKVPLKGSRGFKDAATSEILITRAWDDHPDANIGMATGKTAGAWVLDIDGEKGSQSLTAMENDIGPLPETLEQRTGSGGRHLFFRWPVAREVRNKQSLRPGIDIRGEGGYIVLPPSIHPNGKEYSWPYGQKMSIADIPPAWLDAIAPAKKKVAPWDRPAQVSKPTRLPVLGSTPLLERAKLYLAECEPAVQGSGGHNALLWAARAMVIGFGLDDETALGLLWSEFNPLCSPPWDQVSERKDFERKVTQARSTPGEKPPGWLLDEYGLRSGEDAMANIVAGNRHADALLAKHAAATPRAYVPVDDSEAGKRMPFPVELFPSRIADYCQQASESKVVCTSFFGLPMLAVAGVAMGNAWRLMLKKDFIVPPILWVALVARSGGNKTAPLKQVKAPLDDPVIMSEIEDAILNPQGIIDVGDVTTEMTIQLLQENPRGLLVFRDELAGWAGGFDAYKKAGSGGDQQKWIEFWGAGPYRMHRKTNNERVFIPAAAVTIMGGMQPKILQKCFDPGKFDSGLVPRILVTCPPPRRGRWTEAVVSDEATQIWVKALMWLRTRPFVGIDSNRKIFVPRYLKFDPPAKDVYIDFHNRMEKVVDEAANDHVRAFAAKAQQNAGRMCLIHRGLWLSEHSDADLDGPVGVESVTAGTEWMKWCLAEQMRVYGFAAEQYARDEANKLADKIRSKWQDKAVAVRDIQRTNQRHMPAVDDAVIAVQSLVVLGLARWVEPRKVMVLI